MRTDACLPKQQSLQTVSWLVLRSRLLSYFIEEFLGAEEKAILYSRGLLQVWVSKVVFFVPLLGTTINNPGRFIKQIHFTTKVMRSTVWEITNAIIPHLWRAKPRDLEMALLKNSTALALLNFDQNQSYLRNLIRMQQFSCRDRGTIKYPVALYSLGKHSILWVSEIRGI